MSERIRAVDLEQAASPRIDPKTGWLLLSDYREAVAALALTQPNQYTPQQRALMMLVLSVVSAELDKNAPELFGGKGAAPGNPAAR